MNCCKINYTLNKNKYKMTYTKTIKRDYVEYKFLTGKGNQYVTWRREGNIIESDAYGRVWSFRNKDKYMQVLHTINEDW